MNVNQNKGAKTIMIEKLTVVRPDGKERVYEDVLAYTVTAPGALEVICVGTPHKYTLAPHAWDEVQEPLALQTQVTSLR